MPNGLNQQVQLGGQDTARRKELLQRRLEIVQRKRELLQGQQQMQQQAATPQQAQDPGFIGGLGQAFTGGVEEAARATAESSRAFREGKIGRGESFGEQLAAGAQQLLLPAARVGEAAIAPAVEFATEAFQKASEPIANLLEASARNRGVLEPIRQSIGGTLEDAEQELKSFQQELQDNPEFARKVALYAGATEAAAAPLAALPTAKAVAPVARATVEAAKPVVKAGIRQVERGVEAVKTARQARLEEKAKTAVAQIIQGEKKDIPAAQQALGQIDTVGVKSFEDLSGRLKEGVSSLAKSVDDDLLGTGVIVKPADAVLVQTVGGKTVSTNFLKKAFAHLEELYTKTDAPVDLERIKQLAAKAETQGLNLKEFNDLAREYGVEFKPKAFSKLGDPLTSVNAQSFENVRKGMKNTLRQLVPDAKLRTAITETDKQIASMLQTKKLIDKMQKAADKLEQKVRERGFGEAAGRALGRAIDVVTFGGARGLLTSFIPSNVGNKILNSLDLQDALQKNLKILNKANKAKTPEATAKALNELPVKRDVGSVSEARTPGLEGDRQIMRPGTPGAVNSIKMLDNGDIDTNLGIFKRRSGTSKDQIKNIIKNEEEFGNNSELISRVVDGNMVDVPENLRLK